MQHQFYGNQYIFIPSVKDRIAFVMLLMLMTLAAYCIALGSWNMGTDWLQQKFYPITVVEARRSIAVPVYELVSPHKAIITQYSRKDSCHNKNKAGECITASGQPVHEGAVACSRKYKLGTKFEINGQVYECNDRYAAYLEPGQGKRTLPTLDVFVEANPHGSPTVTVHIAKPQGYINL